MGNKTINFLSKLLLMIILKGTIITGDAGYEYYWRNYDGVSIPNDAVEVEEGSNTYIAQVFIDQHGIFVGTLHKGQNFVEVSAQGDRKVTENIRILCTANPPENNVWLDTTTANFPVDIIGKYPVSVGSDSDHQNIYIGRLAYGGVLVTGNVNSFDNEFHLYFAYGGQEYSATAFQVLVNPPSRY